MRKKHTHKAELGVHANFRETRQWGKTLFLALVPGRIFLFQRDAIMAQCLIVGTWRLCATMRVSNSAWRRLAPRRIGAKQKSWRVPSSDTKHKAVKLMLNTTNHLRDWPYKIMAMFEDWPSKLMGVYHDCPCRLMGVFHDCPGLAGPPGPGPPDYCQVGSSDFLYFVSWIKKGWFLKWDKCKRTSVLIDFHLFINSLELRQTCIFFLENHTPELEPVKPQPQIGVMIDLLNAQTLCT